MLYIHSWVSYVETYKQNSSEQKWAIALRVNKIWALCKPYLLHLPMANEHPMN